MYVCVCVCVCSLSIRYVILYTYSTILLFSLYAYTSAAVGSTGALQITIILMQRVNPFFTYCDNNITP